MKEFAMKQGVHQLSPDPKFPQTEKESLYNTNMILNHGNFVQLKLSHAIKM